MGQVSKRQGNKIKAFRMNRAQHKWKLLTPHHLKIEVWPLQEYKACILRDLKNSQTSNKQDTGYNRKEDLYTILI
jgi:hypothetical protein